MRICLQFVFSVFLCVVSALCAEELPRPLVAPLQEAAKKHEGKDVLVIFTADWDSTGPLLRKWLARESVKAVLKSEGVESFIADCTKSESVGATEMRRHGIHGAPHSAALLHRDGMITFTRLNLTSPETLARDLRALIDKAQQVAPSDGDKPSN